MLHSTSSTFKKLSQATAIATFGISMLAVVASSPASATNLRTFNLSGQFDSQALSGSQGTSVDLENGSFDGSYTVDVDQLPTAFQLSLTNWLVNLRDSSNNVLKTFSSSLIGHTGQVVNDGLLFTNTIASSKGGETASFGLVFAPGFTGGNTVNPSDGLFSSVVYKKITVKGKTLTTIVAGQIPIKPAPVPEPLSVGGIAFAGAMGLWMKRKQQKP